MAVPLVNTCNFVRAIRDAGYSNTSSALAELVDNAIDAGATHVTIRVGETEITEAGGIRIQVLDNGTGMTAPVVKAALQFGGSSRFGHRQGTGRFGMGLPNSSVSQARRVDVYTKARGKAILWSYLDVDAIASGQASSIAEPVSKKIPNDLMRIPGRGTLVVWTRCDRLSPRAIANLVRATKKQLGRIFRAHIWGGIALRINDEEIAAIDPLFLRGDRHIDRATRYGPPLVYDIKLSCDHKRTSRVEVNFSELPISAWTELSNAEKRNRGITKNAGVSVPRARREIDTGWVFMGGKRKENYDDWWRCEIRFEPELDEEFGVTHTKQGIRPSEKLRSLLTPEIEKIAHKLNARVREKFSALKYAQPSAAAGRASRRDILLEPPRAALRNRVQATKLNGLSYCLVVERRDDASFFGERLQRSKLKVALSADHPFYEKFYSVLAAKKTGVEFARQYLELTLYAAARAFSQFRRRDAKTMLNAFRKSWSDNIVAFFT